jgi:superfamily II DNA helicase RecQ
MLINSGVPGKPPEFPGPTIVYCPSRKDVEKVHAELQAHGVDSVMYHAGLSQAVLFIHPPLIILSTLL